MHIVDDGQTARTSVADTKPADSGLGAMELAVKQDIDEIDSQLRVPFHRSLSVLALQAAREIDDLSASATARTQSRRQLFEVLKSLRTKGEGDDNSAVSVALQAAGFGDPLVR